MNPDISIVVVHRGSVPDTSRALASLARLEWPRDQLEVVVVDAGRALDGPQLAQRFPDCRVIEGGDAALAEASNRGAAAAGGRLLAFLAADAKAEPAWLRSAAEVLETDPAVVCVASKVLDWGGERVQFAGGGLGLDGQPVCIGEDAPDDAWAHSARDVLWASRAGFVIARTAFEAAGGFDERFSSVGEDVDLCWRLWLAGERVRYEPRSAVRHRRLDEETRLGPWFRQYLLERNALFCLYKNLGSEHLETALAFATLRAARRATELGKLMPGLLDPGSRTTPDVEPTVHVSKLALAATSAIDDFVRALPELELERARIQASRRRSDAELFRLFGDPFADAVEAPSAVSATTLLRHGLNLDRLFAGRRRVLVTTAAPMTAPVHPEATRTRHLAVELASEHEVVVVTLGIAEDADEPVPIRSLAAGAATTETLQALAHWSDVIVTTPEVVGAHAWMLATSRVIVADLHATLPTSTPGDGPLESLLHRADYLLAADERHRDLWLGRLAGSRLRSAGDPANWRPGAVVGIVPSGVADEARPERRPSSSLTIVWGAARHDDLDPVLAVRALHELRRRERDVTLVFTSPSADVERIAADLAIAGSHTVMTGWLTDAERRQVLVDADVALLTHDGELEACLGFNDVLVEYLWAGLPVVTTAGSALATTIAAAGAGQAVPPNDLDALVSVLDSIVTDDVRRRAMARAASALGAQSGWAAAAAPLIAFCREARRAPNAVTQVRDTPTGTPRGTAWTWGGVRQDIRIVSALLKEGGPRLALAQAVARARRLRGDI